MFSGFCSARLAQQVRPVRCLLYTSYGLREMMNRQGTLLARVYEEREGVPFPAVEHYFRAVFRADHKLDTKASFCLLYTSRCV